MFYVMKSDASYAAGAHILTRSASRRDAERAARKLDTTLNGRPMGRTFVLDQEEFDAWHLRNVVPLYIDES